VKYARLDRLKAKEKLKEDFIQERAKLFAEANTIDEYKLKVFVKEGKKVIVDRFILHYFSKCYGLIFKIPMIASMSIVLGFLMPVLYFLLTPREAYQCNDFNLVNTGFIFIFIGWIVASIFTATRFIKVLEEAREAIWVFERES